jgi:hypothetical protein
VSKKYPCFVTIFFNLKSEITFLNGQIFKKALKAQIMILFFLLAILDTSTLAKTTNQVLLTDNKDFKPKILVLHSYHYGFTWSDKISRGIQSVFAEDAGKVELLFEFMDTRRIYDENYFKQLKELYRVKYARGSAGFLVGVIHSEFSTFDIKMISQCNWDNLEYG